RQESQSVYAQAGRDLHQGEHRRSERGEPARRVAGHSRAPGWKVVEQFSDHGISGAKDRDKRPAFDRMLKGATRREFDIIAAWRVDRLGRSLQHLVAFYHPD